VAIEAPHKSARRKTARLCYSCAVSADLHLRLNRATAGVRDRLATPALVIDLDAVRHNIAAIVARFGDRWRPHVKTLKQAAIFEQLFAAGVCTSKCATKGELDLVVETARRLGHRPDVLFAYPLHKQAFMGLADELADPGISLQVLADSPAHLEALDQWACSLIDGGKLAKGTKVEVALDVDLGMHRTGTPPAAWMAARTRLGQLQALAIRGLHGYDGHLHWEDRYDAHAGYDALCELALCLPEQVRSPAFELVTSGTHSYVHALNHPGLACGKWRHQVSPGTIILSDRRSHRAAADLGLRQAAFVASRVISSDNHARLTLDAGSKGIAPDCPPPTCSILGWPHLRPGSPSEEHLPVAIGAQPAPAFGELCWLIPEHVCTTVNLYRRALLIDEAGVVGESPIAAAGHRLWVTEAS